MLDGPHAVALVLHLAMKPWKASLGSIRLSLPTLR